MSLAVLETWNDLQSIIQSQQTWDWMWHVKAKCQEVRLTPRETEITLALFKGYTNAEIAYELGIKETTIKNVMTIIMDKFEAPSRQSLILKALGIL